MRTIVILVISLLLTACGTDTTERDRVVNTYCQQAQSAGYFKGNFAKCVEQNRRAWDGSDTMADLIRQGWQG